MRYLLSAAFAVACAASASSAMAAGSQIGILECRGASQQFIVGSITNLQCLFRPTFGGRPQAYDAQIRRAGLDIGFNQSTVLAWSVFAPNTPAPGILSGTYVGPSANATLRRRCWRQRPVGRLQQDRRAPAGQRAGTDRVRRGRRHLGDGDARAPAAARQAPPSSPALIGIQRGECSCAAVPNARWRFSFYGRPTVCRAFFIGHRPGT